MESKFSRWRHQLLPCALPAGQPLWPTPGFTATPLKFFPIVQGRPSDYLELLKSQRKRHWHYPGGRGGRGG